MVEWKPKPSDIEWVKELLRILKDGGTWAVPCSCGIFTFYKSKKEYTFVGNREDPTDQKTFTILKQLGWKEKIG